MRELEFLPEWYPQARRRHRLVHLQGGLTMLLILGMGIYLVLADRNIHVAEESVTTLRAQLTQTDAQLAEMEKLDVMRLQLRKQEQVVSRLGVYVEACKMVDTIDNVMPKQMSLVGMQVENDERVDSSATAAAKASGDSVVERRLKVRIQGVCPTDVDLANFMTQLSTVSFFDQVNITYAREKSDNGHIMREFEVSFSMNLNLSGT